MKQSKEEETVFIRFFLLWLYSHSLRTIIFIKLKSFIIRACGIYCYATRFILSLFFKLIPSNHCKCVGLSVGCRLTIRYFLARNKHLFVLLSVKKSIRIILQKKRKKSNTFIAYNYAISNTLDSMLLYSHK